MGLPLTLSVRWVRGEEQIWNRWRFQGVNVPAHCEESFSYRHPEPDGSVLSPDGAKYVLTG